MPNIYLITDGHHSAVRIDSVWTTEKKANKRLKKLRTSGTYEGDHADCIGMELDTEDAAKEYYRTFWDTK